MAILKDTVISGSLRATDTIYSTTSQFQILRAPTSSNGTDYGPGSANNILKSNGTSVYWTTLTANDIPSISITDKTTGTLPVTRGGTGSTSAAGARINLELGSMAIETATDYLNISSLGIAITANSNLNTDYNTPGIYYSYANDRTATLSGAVPVTGSGFKLITSQGYRDLTLRQFCSGSSMMLNYRSSQDKGTTWTNWYRFVFLPSNNDSTYTAIGGATQPVYVTSAGVITAGTALKALAYKDSLVASDIPTNISITGNAANVTGIVQVDHGGTGSASSAGARTNLELGNAKIFYGVCSTAAGTTAKTVECSEFIASELKAGAAILITFTNTNTGTRTALTLNVNSTGAKPIKKQYNGSQPVDLVSAGELQAGNTYLFVYNASFNSNAGAWVLITTDYNNTYDISAVSSASGANRQMETAANGGLGSHRYTLEMMTLNQKWSAISAVSGSTDANQGTAVAKVVSTADFLLNSPILYTNTNLYTAPGGSNDLNGYTATTMNLRYSIGTTASNVSLTYQKPVYLVGIVNSDDVTFKLDATKWWTQDLPTTNDGKIYIFLGMAYSSASIYLHTNHPIYYHNGTTVKVYNPGLHIKDETQLTNDSNEYISVSETSLAHIENAAACPAENVVINIEPVQDLHGYDAPWPAGGGKNKLEVTSTSTTQNGVTITVDSDGIISLSGTATDQIVFEVGHVTLSGEYILSGCPSGGNYSTYFLFCISYDYGSGATVTFDGTRQNIHLYVRNGVNTNGLVFKPMIRLASETDATFAPYENLCPITGWDGVAVTDEGKNLADPSKVLNGYITDDGDFAQNIYYRTVVIDDLKPGTYTFSVTMTATAYITRLLFDDIVSYVAYTGNEFTFTTTKSGVVKISFRNATTTEIGVANIQVELGSTASAYEPYKSRTASVDFSETVYGGTVDLTTGECVVDRAMVDLGTLEWGVTADRFIAGVITPNPLSKSTWDVANPMAICSQYKYGVIATRNGVDKAIGFFGGTLFARDTAYSSASDFKAAMSGVQLVYELANPTILTIAPTDIMLFNGINNISPNCGKISFDYHTNIYPVVIDKSGNLAVQVSLDANNNNSLTLGSTTLTEEQLQTLLSFTRAAGEEF